MDLSSVLAVKADKVERPKNPPMGYYKFKVSKAAVFGEAGKNGAWKTVDFPLQAVDVISGVDLNELREFGAVTSINLRRRFMFSTDPDNKANIERATFELKEFLTKHLGLPSDLILKELIALAPNNQCKAEVTWRADPQNPQNMYAEIKSTAPLD